MQGVTLFLFTRYYCQYKVGTQVQTLKKDCKRTTKTKSAFVNLLYFIRPKKVKVKKVRRLIDIYCTKLS